MAIERISPEWAILRSNLDKASRPPADETRLLILANHGPSRHQWD